VVYVVFVVSVVVIVKYLDSSVLGISIISREKITLMVAHIEVV
jgi:hypothetical protein